MRSKVKDVVFKHDASRIVQTVVKWGGQKERDEIAKELGGSYKELAQNKYSKVRIFYLFIINGQFTGLNPLVLSDKTHTPLSYLPIINSARISI